jgi:Mrp family chromosome partitioning ATPase
MNHTLQQFDNGAPAGADIMNIVPAQLWRRRWLFALVFSLIMLPVSAAVLLWPPVFYASGTVIIGNLEPTESAMAATIQKLGDPADLASQILIAKSPRMLRLALERPGVLGAVHEECHQGWGLSRLLSTPHCSQLKPGSKKLLDFVSLRYVVQAEGRSRIISIGYRSPLPRTSFILANALLITYLEDQRAVNARDREVAAQWVLNAAKARDENRSEANGLVEQSDQNFYQNLYKKATDLEKERRDLPNPARLVSLAELPSRPSFPKPLHLLAAGLAIATMFAGILALRRDLGDQSVRRTHDVESLTSQPVLAYLPRGRVSILYRVGLKHQNRDPVLGEVAAGWESPSLADAARALCAQLMLWPGGKSGRCILVASSSPGEGKTFTTIALARAAVECRRRVLMIDCDLRSLTAAAGSDPQAANGLAGVLRGEIEPHKAIAEAGLKGLDAIKAGHADSDPAMLFIDGQLSRLINWASQYDLILLDGPSGFVPELRILASHADGVLWCVRWGYTLLCDVRADLEKLRRERVNLVGLAVTRVNLKEMRYYQRKPSR